MAISRISSNMVNEIHMLADITVGKGLVTQSEIISAIDSELSYVIKKNDENVIIGFSLNEKINSDILTSIYKRCDETFGNLKDTMNDMTSIVNLSALGIMPQYQRHGYGRLLFQTVISIFKAKYDCITALAWKKGDEIPMKKLFEQEGLSYLGMMKSPYKDVKGLYCEYCKSDVCLCDSCLYAWNK